VSLLFFAKAQASTAYCVVLCIAEDIIQYDRKWRKHVARMEEDTSLTIMYLPSGRHDLGRSKQRWKDQGDIQDQEQVLMDENLNS
jgi:hypothetical protein